MNAPHIHVFLGPTLPYAAAQTIAKARYCPPAAMGDITAAVVNGAEAIILVDGVFERGPSVWHKEIMWALSRDIPVIGASSMGALRASELNRHGMLGYGTIYEAYANGELTDDDDVAVAHAPAELGWIPLTDAMVDIRHRVKQAVAARIITATQAETINTTAKSTFFKERKLSAILCETLGNESESITAWFGANTQSQKQVDCENLLRNLTDLISQAQRRLIDAPLFIPTVYLHRLEKFGFNPELQKVT